VCMSALQKKIDLSSQHQTWYIHSSWQLLAVLRKWGQMVKGQGHTVMHCWRGYGLYRSIWLLRFLVLILICYVLRAYLTVIHPSKSIPLYCAKLGIQWPKFFDEHGFTDENLHQIASKFSNFPHRIRGNEKSFI